jgi:hypothetical protein
MVRVVLAMANFLLVKVSHDRQTEIDVAIRAYLRLRLALSAICEWCAS